MWTFGQSFFFCLISPFLVPFPFFVSPPPPSFFSFFPFFPLLLFLLHFHFDIILLTLYVVHFVYSRVTTHTGLPMGGEVLWVLILPLAGVFIVECFYKIFNFYFMLYLYFIWQPAVLKMTALWALFMVFYLCLQFVLFLEKSFNKYIET